MESGLPTYNFELLSQTSVAHQAELFVAVSTRLAELSTMALAPDAAGMHHVPCWEGLLHDPQAGALPCPVGAHMLDTGSTAAPEVCQPAGSSQLGAPQQHSGAPASGVALVPAADTPLPAASSDDSDLLQLFEDFSNDEGGAERAHSSTLAPHLSLPVSQTAQSTSPPPPLPMPEPIALDQAASMTLPILDAGCLDTQEWCLGPHVRGVGPSLPRTASTPGLLTLGLGAGNRSNSSGSSCSSSALAPPASPLSGAIHADLFSPPAPMSRAHSLPATRPTVPTPGVRGGVLKKKAAKATGTGALMLGPSTGGSGSALHLPSLALSGMGPLTSASDLLASDTLCPPPPMDWADVPALNGPVVIL